MEIILKQDVAGLGYKNDTVKVKSGYGRNFLIPNGSAIIANDSNKRMIAENIRQAAHKAAKLKQDAEALAAKIGELVVEIKTTHVYIALRMNKLLIAHVDTHMNHSFWLIRGRLPSKEEEVAGLQVAAIGSNSHPFAYASLLRGITRNDDVVHK